MLRLLWPFGVIFIALMLASPAAAQPACDTHEKVIARLQEGYGEQVRFRAFDQNGRLIEVLVSQPSTQGRVTWTLVRTAPGGPTCLLTAGEGFEEVLPISIPIPSRVIMMPTGHLQGGYPQGTVYALCLDEGTALEISPLSENEVRLRILSTDGCFRLVQRTLAWMTRVAGCVVNADGKDVCVVEIHDNKNTEAYTWIKGTEAEIAPLMNNWGR